MTELEKLEKTVAYQNRLQDEIFKLRAELATLKEQNAVLTKEGRESKSRLKANASVLIHLAAQMAMRHGMPDTERVVYSASVPKKTWRSINKLNIKVSEQCGNWAYDIRKVADDLLIISAEPK